MSDKKDKYEHLKLTQLPATAICGNDILSSVLYLAGFTITFAGIYAPLVLLVISLVLFFYKKVYTEVVEALPVNGGAYNCLLNGTSKNIASVAGVMTILSYIATAVISGKVGIQYLFSVLPLPETVRILGLAIEHNDLVIYTTILLLLFFALLVISGIKDSAKVAMGIFFTHIFTLTLFIILGVVYILSHGDGLFVTEIYNHTKSLTFNPDPEIGILAGFGIINAVYFAFSTSLLGVTGFESSANFVEEQKEGVFRKTLRNMLIGVTIFNPIIAFILLNALPYDTFTNPETRDFLLGIGSNVIGGPLFNLLVGVDGFLVLAGAVLTAFVGVSGLISRMAADNCFPNFLAVPNKKGSFPKIIWFFFLACTSIILITHGDLASLAGVYTIAFLGVMSLFAFGNLILKETRTELKRTYQAPIMIVILALCATLLGITGNIRVDANNIKFFEMYFIPFMTIVIAYIYQDYLLKFLYRISKPYPKAREFLRRYFDSAISGNFVVFVHHIARLHEILEYVNRNEIGWNIYLVHCSTKKNPADDKDFQEIEKTIPILQKAGVYPHFNIRTIFSHGEFGPEKIDEISKELNIPKNRILIGSIHHHHPFNYQDLGGVRIIF